MTTIANEALNDAERALMGYLTQRRRDGALGFDEYCARRPELAGELRLLYGSLRRISRVLKGPTDSHGWPRGWWRVA